MTKQFWLLSAGVFALSTPAMAQDRPEALAADAAVGAIDQGDIIVTATRRSQALSDVPLAVSAVTADTLRNSGATDIRQLNQVSPSLLVSSTSSEAGAGGARIRGVGTVGDNAGLESSVATFIDGVYRNRAGVGLTELGAIDRIEVLRGPQGTLFGRNASAGLIHVITAKPQFEFGGTAEASYGNYDFMRGVIGITGPIAETLAFRIDGVYTKRDGFLKDVVSGRDLNNRDRWLVRGQLLYEPSDGLSVRIIGDYSDRNEECCAAAYLPTRNVSTSPANTPGGTLVFSPSTIAGLVRGLGGIVNEDTFSRRVALTPGQSYRSDVRDYGVSGEVNWDLGGAQLTSISAYRNWRWLRGQDSDFNNLDLLHRQDDGTANQRFRTFTQELRLQGEAFDGKLDWLVGAYYANEKLTLNDNLSYGANYGLYGTCQIASLLGGLSPASAACLNPAVRAGLNSGLSQLGALGPQVTAGLDRIATLNNVGIRDRYDQTSRNYAFFTHNVFEVTDKLSVTIGARYTNERKTLDASFSNSPVLNSVCGTNNAIFSGVRDNPAFPASLRQLAGGLISLSCVNPSVPNAALAENNQRRSEDEWTYTGVISYKPVPELLLYASYSKGYKAGGFNLDRNGLNRAGRVPYTDGSTLINGSGPILATADLSQLEFEAEGVHAVELGAKYNGRGFDLNVSAFHQVFDNFQLNTFNGVNFVVENINGCGDDLGTAPTDSNPTNGACTGKVKGGVVSRGVEIEAFMTLSPDVHINQGFTLSDTKYRHNLVGTAGRPLNSAFFQLPGSRLSNSAKYTVTGSAAWTPAIGSGGLRGLVYVDYRYQSALNTGSDLDIEKVQDGVMVVNARVGLSGADGAWSLEFWGQNIFDVDYYQVAFDSPLQGSGTTRATQAFGTTSSQLFGAFLAEPRTYGVTVRTKF